MSFLFWAASEDLESSAAANRVCVCVCTVCVWIMISGQRVRFPRRTHMQKRLFWGKSASGVHPAAQSDRRTFTQSSLCTWEEEREKAKINDGLYFSQTSLFNSESNYFRFSTSEGRSERENCTEMILWISYIWRLWWKAREKREIKLLHMCSCVYKCSVFVCVCVCVCVRACVCVCVASLAVFLSVETLFSGEMDDASFWHLYKTTHTHKHTHTHTRATHYALLAPLSDKCFEIYWGNYVK